VRNFLIVGVGGFFGAMARNGTTSLVALVWARDFPLATFLINVTGSFVLGVFSTLATERFAIDPPMEIARRDRLRRRRHDLLDLRVRDTTVDRGRRRPVGAGQCRDVGRRGLGAVELGVRLTR